MYISFKEAFKLLKPGFLILVFISIMLISCDSGEPGSYEENDRGNYSINVYPDSLKSYAEGGGVFIYELVPGSDFDGKVLLDYEADPKLGVKLSYNNITKSARISEIAIYPTVDIDTGRYSIILNLRHKNGLKKIRVIANILKYIPKSLSQRLDDYKYFVQYIEKHHTSYKIGNNDKWHLFINVFPPMCSLYLNLLDDRYQISYVISCASRPIRFEIRKRNIDIQPNLILVEERDGNIHRE